MPFAGPVERLDLYHIGRSALIWYYGARALAGVTRRSASRRETASDAWPFPQRALFHLRRSCKPPGSRTPRPVLLLWRTGRPRPPLRRLAARARRRERGSGCPRDRREAALPGGPPRGPLHGRNRAALEPALHPGRDA